MHDHGQYVGNANGHSQGFSGLVGFEQQVAEHEETDVEDDALNDGEGVSRSKEGHERLVKNLTVVQVLSCHFTHLYDEILHEIDESKMTDVMLEPTERQ